MSNPNVILNRDQLSSLAAICGVPEPITAFVRYRAEPTGVVIEIPDETNPAPYDHVTDIADPNEIRGWIRALRERHGFNQTEVARIIRCGPDTLRDYEVKNGPLPEHALVARIACFYGVPVPKVNGVEYGTEACAGALELNSVRTPKSLAEEMDYAGQLMAAQLPSKLREDGLIAFRTLFFAHDRIGPNEYARAMYLAAKMEVASRKVDLPRAMFDSLHDVGNPVTVGSILALARSHELRGLSVRDVDKYGRRFLNRPLIDVPASMATVACATVRLLSGGLFTDDLADHSGKTLEGIFFNAHTLKFVGSRVLMDKLREGLLPYGYTFMVAFLNEGDQSAALDNLKRLFGYR